MTNRRRALSPIDSNHGQVNPDPTLIGPRNHHSKHQMAFQSCLYPGSITHLKYRYELATQMSVTIATSGLGQHVAWSFLSDRG